MSTTATLSPQDHVLVLKWIDKVMRCVKDAVRSKAQQFPSPAFHELKDLLSTGQPSALHDLKHALRSSQHIEVDYLEERLRAVAALGDLPRAPVLFGLPGPQPKLWAVHAGHLRRDALKYLQMLRQFVAKEDKYAVLRALAKKMGPTSRLMLEMILDKDGACPLKDIAHAVEWEGLPDEAYNSRQKAINIKLKPKGWRIKRDNNTATLIDLAKNRTNKS